MLSGKRVPYFRIIFMLLIAFVLYRLVNNTELIAQGFKYIVSLMSYFIWGFAIAYLLNPLMAFIERRFKLRRVFSLPIVYVVFIGLIVFIFVVMIPIVITNIKELFEHILEFLLKTQDTLEQFVHRMGWLQGLDMITYFENNVQDILDQIDYILKTPLVESNLNDILSQMNKIFSQTILILLTQAVNLTTSLFKVLFGLVLSIYMLKDKEGFTKQSKRLLIAFVPKEHAEYILDLTSKAHRIFTQYLIGKTLDSLVIAILCYIGLLILRAPYPLLLSIIVGITNMIPYFGPFIGMIPAVIITLFFSPIKALWVAIFIILLQQLDGLVIGPKILGGSVGLRPFWIIVAIILGGGLFGVLGMLLGVPVLAVLKLVIDGYVEKRIKDKQIISSP